MRSPVPVRIVGFCASCAIFVRYAAERPVRGLARFGRCRLGVVPLTARVSGTGGCARYRPTRRGGRA